MKVKTLAPLALASLLSVFPGADAEELASASPAPVFRVAMVLDAASPSSMRSMMAIDEDSAPPNQTTKTIPRLLEGKAPSYPENARLSRVQGSISITGMIDPQGHLQDLEFDSNQSKTLVRFFRASISKALSDWRFSPGTVNDQAVPVSIQLTVRYKLVPVGGRLTRDQKAKA